MKIEPVAYLYHDAGSAETANPLLHSTLIVFASERKPTCRNETPLYTEAQLRQLGEACAQVAGPEDSYQDEWFNAKADAVNKINALIKELLP